MQTNVYTTPLQGTPDYRNAGIIKVRDFEGNRYNVGKIIYERYDDQNFQYVFSPYWDMIQYLPQELFGGIPGIDMDIRKEHYYRVNMTPSFIAKRTPSRQRENIRELLDEVGLDYYDRFEWLLRTERSCGDDNFIVERLRAEPLTYDCVNDKILNDLQPGDAVRLKSLSDVFAGSKRVLSPLFRLIQSGASIYIEEGDIHLSVETEKNTLYLLERMMAYDKRLRSIRQKEGIQKAKEEGKYKGRKRLPVDALQFDSIVNRFEEGMLTEKEALEQLNMSRSTFYRRIKEKRNQS